MDYPHTVRALIQEKRRLIDLASEFREIVEFEREIFKKVKEIDLAVAFLNAPEEKMAIYK